MSNQKQKATAKPVHLIKTLDQLQTLVDQTVQCRFELDGSIIELPVKRITPAVAEKERQIKRAVQPPWHTVRKEYDPLDKKYLEERDLSILKARAFVVYSCCPAVASKKPGLTGAEEIFNFVQGCLTENILNFIAIKAQEGGMNIDLEAQGGGNFTPAPDSES